MKFIILTSASHPNKLMGEYVSQLAEAGIPYQTYPNAMRSNLDGTIGLCVATRRQWAMTYEDYDRLIITDSWDVLCFATKEQIEATLSTLSDSVLLGAERNCYPEAFVSGSIPDRGIWRYANGGLMTASPAELYRWCEEVEHHAHYEPAIVDQTWYNRRLSERDPIIEIDWQTRLFYCMYLDQGELTVRDGRPFNSVHQTQPAFIHFNGQAPWGPFLAMMEAKA